MVTIAQNLHTFDRDKAQQKESQTSSKQLNLNRIKMNHRSLKAISQQVSFQFEPLQFNNVYSLTAVCSSMKTHHESESPQHSRVYFWLLLS